MKKEHISNAVIRRLPRYFRHLNDLLDAGTVRVSSSALGASLGVTASQIRQDLSCFGEFGQQGYGYHVETLRNEIAAILGIHNEHTAIVLGAGNLGRALMENFHFSRSGFTLVAAFDTNPALVDASIGEVPIYHGDTLEDYLSRHKVDVAVLTVPQTVARQTADRLIQAGVRGIWNFTNIELDRSDPSVVVEDVHFADSLLALSYLISERDSGD
jgi:redox-sensing transcriptional repressor